jgi:CRP/FNR family transcriptional regulator, cyclic AMP receptor protein
MACNPEVLKAVSLFALLDEEELAVLASQVELRNFAPRQRIYKMGEPSAHAFIMVSGSVQVTTIDEDNQVVLLDMPIHGEVFGFASMLAQTPHQTDATAIEATECIEVDLNDITVLLRQKPDAGLDLLSVMGKQFHATERLVRLRAARNPNDVIEEAETLSERVADVVASFGGSWTFIILFAGVLLVYSATNVELGNKAWDPYPFILLNLFLSMLAAIQAPIIMMSQNRQDKKDRLRSELDFEVNRRAHVEIQGLAHRINLLHDKIDDVDELIRKPKASLLPEKS